MNGMACLANLVLGRVRTLRAVFPRGLMLGLTAFALSPSAAPAVDLDYALPFTRSLNGTVGISIASMSDFTQQAIVQPSPGVAAGNIHIVYSGIVVNGIPAQDQPDAVVFSKDGRWYRSSLHLDRSHQPYRVGQANAAPICSSAIGRYDFKRPSANAILYAVPGLDGTCGTSDDEVRQIGINARRTDPYIVTPLRDVRPYVLYDSHRTAKGFIQLEDSTLYWYSLDFTQRKTICSNLGRWATLATLGSGDVILSLDGKIWRVSPTGDLVGARLASFDPATLGNQATNDRDAAYVPVQRIMGTDPDLYRLVRIAFATGEVRTIGSGSNGYVELRQTGSRIVAVRSTDAGSHELVTYRKNGDSRQVATPILEAPVGYTPIVVATRDNRIWFNVVANGGGFGPQGDSHAYVASDTGAILEDYGPHSVLVGVVPAPDVHTNLSSVGIIGSSGFTHTDYVLLGKGGSGINFDDWTSLRLSDDTSVALPVPAATDSLTPFGSPPYGQSVYFASHAPGGLGLVGTHLFAADLDSGRAGAIPAGAGFAAPILE